MCGGIWRGNAKANASMGKLLSRALSDIHSHGEAMRRSFWNSAMVNSVLFLLFCLFCNNIAFIQHSTYDGETSVPNVSSLGLESTDAESKKNIQFQKSADLIHFATSEQKKRQSECFCVLANCAQNCKISISKGDILRIPSSRRCRRRLMVSG